MLQHSREDGEHDHRTKVSAARPSHTCVRIRRQHGREVAERGERRAIAHEKRNRCGASFSGVEQLALTSKGSTWGRSSMAITYSRS